MIKQKFDTLATKLNKCKNKKINDDYTKRSFKILDSVVRGDTINVKITDTQKVLVFYENFHKMVNATI
jgi:hypothetical protein